MAPPGVLTDATEETLATTFTDKVTGHVWLAKALVPLLKPEASSSFSFITGMIGEVCPWPNVALTAIGNSAVFGAVVALQAELQGQPPRVNEVRGWRERTHAQACVYAGLLMPPPAPPRLPTQIRIAALLRRDDEADNPSFAGAPAAPVSKLAAKVVGVAAGDARDSVLRIMDTDLA